MKRVFILCLLIALAGLCFAEVVDDFETGVFSEGWVETNIATIINIPGDGAGGSDYYVHVTGAAGEGDALGSYFTDSTDFTVSDFSLSFNFRFTDTDQRQFNLIVGTSDHANSTGAGGSDDIFINLAYDGIDERFEAYEGGWQTLNGLPTGLSSGLWHSVTIVGRDFGTASAQYDIAVNGTTQTAISIFHGHAVATSLQAGGFNFNDNYGSNPGFDIDDVSAYGIHVLSVNVGADRNYERSVAPLTLEAMVVDDGDPDVAVLAWSQTNGPGVATFTSPNSAVTDVTFDAGGAYTLRLTADNTAGGGSEIVYDELEVTVSSPTCQDVNDASLLLAADINGDCYVNMADLAEVMAAWLNCNNPQDSSCDWTYLNLDPDPDLSLVLVQDGQPIASIVIGQQASTTEEYAAEELQLYLQKISGATVPIVTEGGEMPTPAIVIGTPDTCQYIAESGLIAELSLGRDGLLIKTVDDVIILAGENPPGALYATYAFLEEHLGCRWYFRGVEGEYVPAMSTIAIDYIDDTQKPAIEFRGINAVGSAVDDVEIAVWMARNRMNYISQKPLYSYHRAGAELKMKKGLYFNTETFFSHWLNKGELFATHPEYFPLLDGVRVEGFPSGYAGGGLQQHNYCLSNLDLIGIVADAMEDYVVLFPEAEVIGINQMDSVDWCECVPCSEMGSGSTTDRLHLFINRLVAELDSRGSLLDNRMLSTQAYMSTGNPPVNVTPNEKIIIFYTLINHCARHDWDEECYRQESSDERLTDWLEYDNKVVVYTYHSACFPGFPLPMAYHARAGMKYYHETGISGWYPETAADDPGQNPLIRDPELLYGDSWYSLKETYYTAAKALWNSEVTLEEIKDDFFPKFYGAAGPAMRNYYETLEQAWHYPGDVILEHKRVYGYDPTTAIDFLSPTLIDTMNGYLAEAVSLYAGEPQVVKDRVDRDVEMFAKWEKRYDDTGGIAEL